MIDSIKSTGFACTSGEILHHGKHTLPRVCLRAYSRSDLHPRYEVAQSSDMGALSRQLGEALLEKYETHLQPEGPTTPRAGSPANALQQQPRAQAEAGSGHPPPREDDNLRTSRD